MSVWKNLSKIDVNEHTEAKEFFQGNKKVSLTYLSWAWAWGTLKKECPDATYEILDDIIYPDSTVEVRVSVTVEGQTHMMWLPVMDNKNRSISGPTSKDISDARMRCLVKAIAMHGLGHYIYAGEDVPQSDGEDRQSEVKENPNPTPTKETNVPTPSSQDASEKSSIEQKEEDAPGDKPLGKMFNTAAYKPEDREGRTVFTWDDWATVSIAWVDQIKSVKGLNTFYSKNKELFVLAKAEAFTKYEEVIEKIAKKKTELEEKK